MLSGGTTVRQKSGYKEAALQFFQKLARALLIPVSLLAAASLIMGVGSIFQQSMIINMLPFLANTYVSYFFTLMVEIGFMVLGNLPLVYAIALAFSLVEEDKEHAAFSGALGYYAFICSMGLLIDTFPQVAARFPENAIVQVLGIKTINVGILGGMIVGICVAFLHKKFRTVKLPIIFSFFQGVRFVPVISIIVMFVLGQVFPFFWVYFSQFIDFLGHGVAKTGVFGPFIFGTVERLLIPTGLHQIWNSIIRDTAVSGVFEFASGQVIIGASPAYAHFLVEGPPINASMQELVKYLFGPQNGIMLGALPGIGLAIYQCADLDKRKNIKPLVLAAVFSAVFAGISEPLEFIFLFAAPVLYGIYAVLNGLSWLLFSLLGSTIGSDSGIIGFLVHGVLREGCNWWVGVAVAAFEFVTCYLLFKWWIIRFDVKTPGRGGENAQSIALAAEIGNIDLPVSDHNSGSEPEATINPAVLKARQIIKGLGGKENIREVEACFSRLRVTLNDMKLVDESILRSTGCNGIMKPDEHNIQVIYGTTVGLIKNAVRKELKLK